MHFNHRIQSNRIAFVVTDDGDESVVTNFEFRLEYLSTVLACQGLLCGAVVASKINHDALCRRFLHRMLDQSAVRAVHGHVATEHAHLHVWLRAGHVHQCL
jgi:hypothetical protein